MQMLIISIIVLSIVTFGFFIATVVMAICSITYQAQINSLLQLIGVDTYEKAVDKLQKNQKQTSKKTKDFLDSFFNEEEWDDVAEWDNEYDEEVESATKLNKNSKVGDRATFNCNIFYDGSEFNVDIPVILVEKSLDGTKLKFDLDTVNIPEDSPFNHKNFISYLELVILNNWVFVESVGITWREGNGKYLELSPDEQNDIRSFLKYTLIPADKQEKIKNILKI